METGLEPKPNTKLEMSEEVYGQFMESLLNIRVQDVNDESWVRFTEIAQVLALYLDSKDFVEVLSGFIPMCFNYNPALAIAQLKKLIATNEKTKNQRVNSGNPRYANLGLMIQVVTRGYSKIKAIAGVSYDSLDISADSLNG